MRGHGKGAVWGAFAALLGLEVSKFLESPETSQKISETQVSMLEFCQIQCAITKFIKPIGNLIEILIKSSEFR